MNKQSPANWLFITLWLLAATAILAANIYIADKRLSSLSIVPERRITADGLIYDLRDDTKGVIWLRQISADGRLLAHMPFYYNEEELFTYRTIVDIIGNQVYIYKFDYEMSSDQVDLEAVQICDPVAGTIQTLELPRQEEAVARYVSAKIWQDHIYLGHVLTEPRALALSRLNIKTGHWEQLAPLPLPFDLAYFHYSANGEAYIATLDSKIWRYNQNGWQEVFRPQDREAIRNISIGSKGEIFALITGGERGERLLRKAPGEQVFVPIITHSPQVLNVEAAAPEIWVSANASVIDAKFWLETMFRGENHQITRLGTPLRLHFYPPHTPGHILAELLLMTLVLLVARHILLGRRMMLTIKMVLVTLPILVVGAFFLLTAIASQITEMMYKRTYDDLLQHAMVIEENFDGQRFSQIDWLDPLTDQYYLDLRWFLDHYSRSGTLRWRDVTSAKARETEYYSSYWVFQVREGRAFVAACDNLFVNLDAKYIDKDARYRMIGELLESKEPAAGRTYSTIGGQGYWLNVLYPLFSDTEERELIGFIEAGRRSALVDEVVEDIMARILLSMLMVLGVAALAYLVVLRYFMQALNRLKNSARAIAGGDYSARVKITAADEVAEIAAAFNNMAESVDESYRHIQAIRDGYRQFVPEKMMAILGKKSIEQVGPGTYAHLRANYLLLSTDSFEFYRNKEFFDALSRFYGCVMPPITNAGGVIERYAGRGLTAVFDSSTETALNALIHMFAALDQLNAQLRLKGLAEMECRTMLSYGDSVMGVAGDSRRLNLITVSRFTYEAGQVGRMGKKYGCRVVLTKAALESLGKELPRYRHRLLGYISNDQLLLPIYDFYDSEEPSLMEAKDQTKKMFEEAIEHYYQSEYPAALALLIEVIKKSPRDRAAREYLKESHSRLETGQPPGLLLKL